MDSQQSCTDTLKITPNNSEKLTTLIRGHLAGFYNKQLTADTIDSITLNLMEEFEKFLNTNI